MLESAQTALASGKLRCIGSTTYQEFKASFERDRALSRRFQKIDVPEPSVEETFQILKGLAPKYEEHHKVKYDEDALRSAAELAAKHINEKFLPDKAIDVVDETGAIDRLREKPTGKVTVADIERWCRRSRACPRAASRRTSARRCSTSTKELQAVIYGKTRRSPSSPRPSSSRLGAALT